MLKHKIECLVFNFYFSLSFIFYGNIFLFGTYSLDPVVEMINTD